VVASSLATRGYVLVPDRYSLWPAVETKGCADQQAAEYVYSSGNLSAKSEARFSRRRRVVA